ncbi:GyrI-like domain-containing protein [Robertkochia aurantiaca]|uniref:GyrI-like domain-containing protein n=1 Tax=Robertkochia aurantiaca TaxID=2873700 RepID=UPI001CCBC9B5|nr:GyrI-like domain-containing protein [Robertkochia sp. 3YJGBD-33]
MTPSIKYLDSIQIKGISTGTSFVQNNTRTLWNSFMTGLSLSGRRPDMLYSVDIYPENYFEGFDPTLEFTKWAGVQASEKTAKDSDLDLLHIPAGYYAEFLYQGKASEAAAFYREIFSDWLPRSKYLLDNRPHLAVMGKEYRGEDPLSEETILIPVKKKTE